MLEIVPVNAFKDNYIWTNPFLRCLEPAVVESANKYLGARVADPVRVFAAIRDWKNRS
jgi:hydroxyacylglutathione hydrolase